MGMTSSMGTGSIGQFRQRTHLASTSSGVRPLRMSVKSTFAPPTRNAAASDPEVKTFVNQLRRLAPRFRQTAVFPSGSRILQFPNGHRMTGSRPAFASETVIVPVRPHSVRRRLCGWLTPVGQIARG